MRKRNISVLAALLLALAALHAAEVGRPNILFIMADDLGWRDLSCYGSTFYQTPNLDRLAARGVKFTQAYAANPLCSPTRSSVLTGLWPARRASRRRSAICRGSSWKSGSRREIRGPRTRRRQRHAVEDRLRHTAEGAPRRGLSHGAFRQMASRPGAVLGAAARLRRGLAALAGAGAGGQLRRALEVSRQARRRRASPASTSRTRWRRRSSSSSARTRTGRSTRTTGSSASTPPTTRRPNSSRSIASSSTAKPPAQPRLCRDGREPRRRRGPRARRAGGMRDRGQDHRRLLLRQRRRELAAEAGRRHTRAPGSRPT